MSKLILEQPVASRISKITDEARGIRTFRFDYPIVAHPGQFVLLWIPRQNLKPFGISRLTKDWLEITVCKVGEFTEELFKKEVGEYLGIQGPYGKPFQTGYKNTVLVAGGYGAAPMAFLADVLANEGAKVTFILGAKTADLLVYQNRFANNKRVKMIYVTDDGSYGKKGFTTNALGDELAENKDCDMVYACGPEIMMQKIIEVTDKYNAPCQLSLERYMKCGFGICGQCCVDETGIRVCKEGPVFTKEFIKKNVSEFGRYHREATGMKIT